MNAIATIDADGVLAQSCVSERVPWWSFTKTVMAIAALRLVERGALSLDAKLQGQPYSLRQVLRHEAGLPDYGWLAEYHRDVAAGEVPWAVDRLLVAVDADRLWYAPGSSWAYSNVGYLKVGQLIERVSGRGLAAMLAEDIFGPAGLTSARLATEPEDLADVEMGSSGGYHPGWVYHGLVVGTVSDAARLLWMLVNGRLLRAETFDEMLKGYALPELRRSAHPDAAYGLGLMLGANDPEKHPLGHTGEGPGSRIAVYAKAREVAAVWVALPSEDDAETLAMGMLA